MRNQSSQTTCGTTRCLRCGRTLTSASSVSAQYGRWCRAKIRAAALSEAIKGFTAQQVEKARELIADGGLVATGFAGVWRVVSSAGDAVYMTTATGQCNCPAGLRSGRADRCYHACAARMISAGSAA